MRNRIDSFRVGTFGGSTLENFKSGHSTSELKLATITPLVLIHGYAGHIASFDQMVIHLKEKDYPASWIHCFQYDSLTKGNRDSAVELGEFVAEVLTEHQTQQVTLIAFSNGGLVARWYREKLDGNQFINKLITMGTPHYGTAWAYCGNSPACIDMRPYSTFFSELGSGGCDHALWSPADEMVFPVMNAMSRNSIKTRSVSHNALLTDKSVFEQLYGCIVNEESDMLDLAYYLGL